jgi:acyl-CoA thioesterase-1
MGSAVHASEAVKIVAVGASITWGWGVSKGEDYPALLQVLLRKRGINATVINAGVIGSTTLGMHGRIDRVVPDDTKIVVLRPGGNDLRFFRTKQQRAETIAKIVEKLRHRHIDVIVYDPPIARSELKWDGIHLTAAAHEKIAQTLAADIIGRLNLKKPEAKP